MPFDWPPLVLATVGLGLVIIAARPLAATAERLTTIPWQFYRISVDPRLRRNHALEHATLNVLGERHGKLQVAGSAIAAGFVLRGMIHPASVEAAAREGLARLQAGERALAFHSRCGTSLATAEILTWLVLIGGLISFGRFTPSAVLIAFGLTWLAAPYAGYLIQRFLTTSSDVDGLAIAGLAFRPRSYRLRPESSDGREWWFPGEVIVFVAPAASVARAVKTPAGPQMSLDPEGRWFVR